MGNDEDYKRLCAINELIRDKEQRRLEVACETVKLDAELEALNRACDLLRLQVTIRAG